MGKTITQSRTLYDRVPRELKLAHWANPILSDAVARSVQQTTTSYRSGSRYNDPVVGESVFVRKPSGDNGHEFDTFSRTTSFSHTAYRVSNTAGTSYWDGVIVPDTTGVSSYYGNVPAWANADADIIGSQFIRLTRPTKPSASLATAIGELWADKRVASVIGSATLSDKLSVFQKAGSEYLNVTFGWIPFLAELTDVLNAVVSSEKIISQFVRDSGRIVRRRRSYEPLVEYAPVQVITNRELAYPISGMGPYLEPDAVKRRGTLEVRQWKRVTYSFSAAYTYYLETGGDFFSDLKRFEQLANRLLGTRITPEVLWELVPFSWLVDWMWSTGTFVSNYSAFNGDELVLKYGYVMRQHEHWRQCSLSGNSFGGKSPGTIVQTYSDIRKSRRRSTPYGFGRNPNSFTGAQWAILAALGLTKAPNKLAP